MPSKSDINPATGKAYAVNPSTGVWDDNYFANVVEPQLRGGGGGASSSGNFSVGGIDPLAAARAAQQLQIEANKPAIETLTTQKGSLEDKYKALLDSITQAEQPAVDV